MVAPTCLLIEDSKTQALAMSKLIQSLGWTPFLCLGMTQVNSIADGQKFDCILLDIFLEDGPSLCHIEDLKHRWPNTPIAVMTAGDGTVHAYDALRVARETGVPFLMAKPFTESMLKDVFTDAQAMRRGEDRRIHALVVDDSPTFLQLAQHLLKDSNFRVTTTTRMENVLARLAFDHIDVVVTDIFMPGMGGIEGIQRMRKDWPDVGVVAMSGGFGDKMGHSDALAAAQKVGADATIPKPFTQEQISEAVQTSARRSLALRAAG